MRTDHFTRWTGLLLARLEPGEQVLARGRAYEKRVESHDLTDAISGPGCALVVTERCALWVDRADERWVRALPFAIVRAYSEITQGHRYGLALEHEGIERLQWVPAHRFLAWSWGNAESLRPVTESVLAFSHRHTVAARAIRALLQVAGVPAGEARSLPKRERQAVLLYASRS
jgi:hypothetical protein